MTLPVLTSDHLKSPHGFFGRQGGVSTGLYESLNTGLRSEDDKTHIETNRRLIQDSLGAEQLISLHQVHSDRVVILTNTTPLSDEDLEADGLVTTVPRLAVSALSADCGPVLLCDKASGVVGACHAGWRGALSGIVESTVAAMCELGASPESIRATLGPCIGPENYEVGDDFKSEFTEIDESYARFFHQPAGKKAHFDLPMFILSRLDVMGVQANWTGQCTYALPEQYFSYRRNTHQGLTGYGRNLSAIMLD